MATLRAVFRLLGMSLVTFVLTIPWLVGLPIRALWPKAGILMRQRLVNTWARGLTWCMGMRVRTEGKPPEPPFLLVSNHLSYLDVFVLHSRLYAVFVSKAEVDQWPLVGWLARTFGTIFIDRRIKRDVLRINQVLREALEAGDAVVFFPEGTTHKGDRVYPFKASLLDLAAETGHPVYHATLSYRTPPGAPPAYLSLCWWQPEVPFIDHFWNVLKLPRSEARVVFGADPVRGDERKAIARALEDRVRANFVPVVDPSEIPAS